MNHIINHPQNPGSQQQQLHPVFRLFQQNQGQQQQMHQQSGNGLFSLPQQQKYPQQIAILSNAQKDQVDPSLNPHWRVDNWQIPVPIGDASAHFLIDYNKMNPTNNGKAFSIINAFFMDGGDDVRFSDDKAVDKIILALTAIDKEYGTSWKFDAIVTTHHDRDHYKGLKDLLAITDTFKRDNDIGTFRSLYFATPVTFYSGSETLKWQPTDMNLIAGELCVGVDLFSKTRMFKRYEHNVDHTQKDQQSGIVQYNSLLGNKNRPRFAVVGADGYGCHPTSDARICVPANRNQTSILAVVYWPGSNGRTSYFTGGDGNPLVETTGVTEWMKHNPLDRPQLPVHMVKLDHHGSVGEALTDDALKNCLVDTILPKMKPAKVLVTPGNQHGHPNWAVLQYVRRHLVPLQRSFDQSRAPFQLYTTRSPYWLSKSKHNNLDVNSRYATHEKTRLVHPITVDWEEGQKNRTVNCSDSMSESDEIENNDTLLTNKFEEMGIINEDMDDEKREKAETWGLLTKAGKPAIKKISPILRKEQQKTRAAMVRSYKDPSKWEEPSLNDYQLIELEKQADRQDLIDHARDVVWPSISKQNIIDAGSPYYLIRFWFEDNDTAHVIDDLDEYGQKKDVELIEDSDEAVQKWLNPNWKPDNFEETIRDGPMGETIIEHTLTLENKLTKKGNKRVVQRQYLGSLESAQDELKFLNEQIVKCKALAYWVGLNPRQNVGGLTMNISNKKLKGTKLETANLVNTHLQYLQTSTVANNPWRKGPSSRDLKKINASTLPNPETANFSGWKIRDPTVRIKNKIREVDFDGDFNALLDFNEFALKYVLMDVPNGKFTTKPSNNRVGTSQKLTNIMIKEMHEEHVKAIKHQLSTSLLEYKELQQYLGPLLKELAIQDNWLAAMEREYVKRRPTGQSRIAKDQESDDEHNDADNDDDEGDDEDEKESTQKKKLKV